MKKIIASLLLISVILTLAVSAISCKENEKEEENKIELKQEDFEGVTIIDKEESSTSNEAPQAPGSSLYYAAPQSLTLAKDPVLENGKLVLYFNESIQYDEITKCSISLSSFYEAESINAAPDMEAYPDMKNEDGTYCGVVLVPADEIVPGKYMVAVLVGNTLSETFNMTID